MRRRASNREWPLRLRLTAAFASVIALVLAACGVLIYVQFSRYIDQRTDEELRERSVTYRTLAADEVHPRRIVALSGEEFTQIYDRAGRVVATSRAVRGERLLSPARLAAARRATVSADRRPTPPTQEGVRLHAFPIDDGAVAVIAESRDDRERELDRLQLLLAISLPGALLLASLTGYQVAGAALRPVERMRARAAEISAGDLSGRLDQPRTGDELDRLAHTLNDLLGRLQATLARERRVVGDASHELRTPIAVLRTRLDVALRGPEDVAALRTAIEDARDDAVRLTRLADDLLVLARADQGQLPLRQEPVEAQELLERAVARHAPAAAAAGRALEWDVAIPGGAVLLADPDRADQVLDNLVVNALRYGAGTVTLAVRATADPERLELAVTDEGNGFPPALLGRAFERFSHSEGHGGSGLGLAIVEALVRAHGGTVAAVNGADGGAEVVARLPRA